MLSALALGCASASLGRGGHTPICDRIKLNRKRLPPSQTAEMVGQEVQHHIPRKSTVCQGHYASDSPLFPAPQASADTLPQQARRSHGELPKRMNLVRVRLPLVFGLR
jgi:hypothetical protein